MSKRYKPRTLALPPSCFLILSGRCSGWFCRCEPHRGARRVVAWCKADVGRLEYTDTGWHWWLDSKGSNIADHLFAREFQLLKTMGIYVHKLKRRKIHRLQESVWSKIVTGSSYSIARWASANTCGSTMQYELSFITLNAQLICTPSPGPWWFPKAWNRHDRLCDSDKQGCTLRCCTPNGLTGSC